jgi:hypothetical protein
VGFRRLRSAEVEVIVGVERGLVHVGGLIPATRAYPRDAARQCFDAVENYVAAFNAAEAEAIRRRRSDFSRDGQQRLARAPSLLRVASDTAATPQEREHAYALARTELDGLIVLPERGIVGEIDRVGRPVNRPGCPDISWFRRSVGRPASLLKSVAKSSAKNDNSNEAEQLSACELHAHQSVSVEADTISGISRSTK